MNWHASSETTAMLFCHCLINALHSFPAIKSVHESQTTVVCIIVVFESFFQKQTFGTITRNISVKFQ